MRFKTWFVAVLMTFSIASGSVHVVHAQAYPTKPVRFVVSFPPGGPNDILARIVAQELTESFGQNVAVDNRAGAGGVIGTEIVAKAPANGYTILVVAGGHAINPSLHSKLPYDTLKDFTSISLVASIPSVLLVHPSLPAKSVRELVSLAKARPGQLTFASAGNGTVSHLAGELLKSMSGANMTHVPYKGNPPATTALLSGEVSMYIGGMPSVLPFVKSGRLRALAVTTARRSEVAPEIPTVAESGVPGFDVSPWYGVVAPAGLSPDVLSRLSSEINRVVKLPNAKKKLADQGFEVIAGTPQEFDIYLRKEIAKWAKVVKQSGAKLD